MALGVTCIVALAVCLTTSSAPADYVYMNTVYNFHAEDGLGGAFPGKPWEVFPFETEVLGPYGGTWDNTWSLPVLDPAYQTFGFPRSYITDGRTPSEFIADYIFADPSGDPDHLEVSFVSLPGNGTNNSYVVLGIKDGADLKGIDPYAPGPDIRIDGVFGADEEARVYVSTRTVSDPATELSADLSHSDWLEIGIAYGGADAGKDVKVNEFDLGLFSFTDAILAIAIEGIDQNGESYGFDVSGVFVSEGSITDPGPLGIPEPASVILLAVGGLALLYVRRRRRKR